MLKLRKKCGRRQNVTASLCLLCGVGCVCASFDFRKYKRKNDTSACT